MALPMVLIGAGQGLAFAPMTSAGVSGVAAGDAGAASGLVNTFHQLGSSLGLGILVALASQSARDTSTPAAVTDHVADRVATALTGSSVFLAVALVLTVVLIAPRRRGATAGAESTASPSTASSASPAAS